MANANAPRGLVPVRYFSGAPYNGAANIYFVPATYGSAIYPGDPVIGVTNSEDAGSGIPTVQLASAGSNNYIQGVMVGIAPGGEPQIAVTRDLPVYHPASTAGFILVADDPNLLFSVQEDSNGGALAAGAAGRNVNLVSGAGSATYGTSGWQLQSSSLNTTNTLQMRILRLLEQADNAAGVNAKWLCKINLHQFQNLTGV